MQVSINPFNGEENGRVPFTSSSELIHLIHASNKAFEAYRTTSFDERSRLMMRLSQLLLERKEALARIITVEMGKLYVESIAEIEKCATVCIYYANHAEEQLKPVQISTDASYSGIEYQPLGTIFGIMPWNFPFWQVFRFVAPALMAGNTAILKHASNVPLCAQAIHNLIKDAGFLEGVFTSIFIPANRVEEVISNPFIKAVTLTSSESAGKSVAALSGVYLKKTVVELGGSDPFIVCSDADISKAVHVGVRARMMNAGQSCIAAKRFIIHESIYLQFIEEYKVAIQSLVHGDPMDASTTLAPLARPNLAEELHEQVQTSIRQGAVLFSGGERFGNAFYQPTILTNIPNHSLAYSEELFGPVASMYSFKDIHEAIALANDTRFGLGASVWTSNKNDIQQFVAGIESGSVFINAMVRSDSRLPFGGVKQSGYGRELADVGIKEFVNIKTVYQA